MSSPDTPTTGSQEGSHPAQSGSSGPKPSLVLAAAAAKINLELVGILVALVPGFGLVAATNVGAPTGIGNIGGYFLILSAGFAFYGATALVVNSTYRRPVLPLLSRA